MDLGALFASVFPRPTRRFVIQQERTKEREKGRAKKCKQNVSPGDRQKAATPCAHVHVCRCGLVLISVQLINHLLLILELEDKQ